MRQVTVKKCDGRCFVIDLWQHQLGANRKLLIFRYHMTHIHTNTNILSNNMELKTILPAIHKRLTI